MTDQLWMWGCVFTLASAFLLAAGIGKLTFSPFNGAVTTVLWILSAIGIGMNLMLLIPDVVG